MNYQNAHEMASLALQQGKIAAYSVKWTKETGNKIFLHQDGKWETDPWYIENIPANAPESLPLCHACDSLAISRKNQNLADALHEIIEYNSNLDSKKIAPTGDNYSEIFDIIKAAYLKFFGYSIY